MNSVRNLFSFLFFITLQAICDAKLGPFSSAAGDYRPSRRATLTPRTPGLGGRFSDSSMSTSSRVPLNAGSTSTPNPLTSSSPVSADPKEDEDKCNWCIRQQCNPGGCQEKSDFDAIADAKALHDYIVSKNEKEVIKILTHRSDRQVRRIKEEYQMFKSALRADIENTRFKSKDLLLALLSSRAEFFAEELHKAFEAKDDSAGMIVMLAPMSSCAIQKIGVAYNKLYKTKTFAKGIQDGSFWNFEAFLLELSKGTRQPDGEVNVAQAEQDAESLLKVLNNPNAKLGSIFSSDKNVYIEIFTQRSYSQLREIIKQYNTKRSKDERTIVDDIKSYTVMKLQKGLLAIVQNVLDQPTYFANELEGALTPPKESKGVHDMKMLFRIMRGRCGIDLGDIRDAYPKSHDNMKLATKLAEKNDFHYKEAFLEMLKNPSDTQDKEVKDPSDTQDKEVKDPSDTQDKEVKDPSDTQDKELKNPSDGPVKKFSYYYRPRNT